MAGQDLQRREILRIMAMASVASHFPGFTKWVFACAHPGAAGTQTIKPTKYTPQFCSAQEYALVERLTELIIPSDETPGAREAGAAEFVDFMVAHERGSAHEADMDPTNLGSQWPIDGVLVADALHFVGRLVRAIYRVAL